MVCPLATTLLLPRLAKAADVESFIVSKGQEFRQTNAAAPIIFARDIDDRAAIR